MDLIGKVCKSNITGGFWIGKLSRLLLELNQTVISNHTRHRNFKYDKLEPEKSIEKSEIS